MEYLERLEKDLDPRDLPFFQPFRTSSEALHRLFLEQQPVETIERAMISYTSALDNLHIHLSTQRINFNPEEGNIDEIHRIARESAPSSLSLFALSCYRRSETWETCAYEVFRSIEVGILKELFHK